MSLSKPSYSGAAKRSAMTADARPGLTGDSAKTSEGDETAGGLITADLCVIGAGSGGLSVAAAAAQLGVPVVLDREAQDGRRLPQLRLRAVEGAARRGASGPRPCAPPRRSASRRSSRTIDHARVHDHVHGVIAAIAPNNSVERFTGLGVTRHPGRGPASSTGTRWGRRPCASRARRFVIATGSSPAVPPIPGLDERALFHQRNHLRQEREARIISSSSAADRSAWSWRRRTSASAAASPSSKL